MNDPLMLQYLKDIKDTTIRIEQNQDKDGERISSLERTRSNQRGIMLGGGTVVTFFAGLVTWLMDRH